MKDKAIWRGEEGKDTKTKAAIPDKAIGRGRDAEDMNLEKTDTDEIAEGVYP